MSLAIATVTLTGIMTMSSQALTLVWSTRQSSAATLCLQERVEQLRIATWKQISDSTYLTGAFLNTVPNSAAPLAGLVETITVSAYPGTTGATPIVVERSGTTTRVVSDNASIASESLARIDLQVAWNGDGGRRRTRESVAVVAKTGISRLNLAMAGGGTMDGQIAPDSTPSADPTPGGTPDPSATPAPEPTPNGSGNENGSGTGNANGRGNVGGKSGKK